MLTAQRSELQRRAEAIHTALARAGVECEVVDATAKVGGGALPLLELEGPVCAVEPGTRGLDELARRLRAGDPPLVARAREGRLLLDPRTLTDAEAEEAARAVGAALER
jgi:L-seryl-tRNA(Ser) seleniumtransferase